MDEYGGHPHNEQDNRSDRCVADRGENEKQQRSQQSALY